MELQAKIELRDAHNIAELLDSAETIYAALAEGITLSASETSVADLRLKASGMRMMAKYLRSLQCETPDSP